MNFLVFLLGIQMPELHFGLSEAPAIARKTKKSPGFKARASMFGDRQSRLRAEMKCLFLLL